MDPLIYACASCGAEVSLDVVLARVLEDIETRGLVVDLVTASVPVGGMLARYMRLHKPARQLLTIARVRKLLEELVPEIRRGTLERDGRHIVATPQRWQYAFEQVFLAVDRGTLKLPLRNHNYLYSVLFNQAEAEAARQEERDEQDKRAGLRDTVTVNGQALPIGDALEKVYGDRDPALDKIDADRAKAVAIPDSVKAYQARLKGRIERLNGPEEPQ